MLKIFFLLNFHVNFCRFAGCWSTRLWLPFQSNAYIFFRKDDLKRKTWDWKSFPREGQKQYRFLSDKESPKVNISGAIIAFKCSPFTFGVSFLFSSQSQFFRLTLASSSPMPSLLTAIAWWESSQSWTGESRKRLKWHTILYNIWHMYIIMYMYIIHGEFTEEIVPREKVILK